MLYVLRAAFGGGLVYVAPYKQLTYLATEAKLFTDPGWAKSDAKYFSAYFSGLRFEVIGRVSADVE